MGKCHRNFNVFRPILPKLLSCTCYCTQKAPSELSRRNSSEILAGRANHDIFGDLSLHSLKLEKLGQFFQLSIDFHPVGGGGGWYSHIWAI